MKHLLLIPERITADIPAIILDKAIAEPFNVTPIAWVQPIRSHRGLAVDLSYKETTEFVGLMTKLEVSVHFLDDKRDAIGAVIDRWLENHGLERMED